MVNVKYISSVEDLQNMGKDGYYKLTKNINCDGFDFESIPEFQGTLDGNSHTVKNLKIRGKALIDVGYNVTIKNIQFDNLNVKGHASLIKDLYGKCKFENVIVKNSTISGSYDVGGFVGFVYSSSVVKCSNCKLVNSKITAGSADVGGFVGSVYSSSIMFSECDVSSSNVTAGSYYVGGFVGYVSLSSVIVSDNVIEKSNLAGNNYVGGFVGSVSSSSKVVNVSNSVVSGCKVSAKEEYVGSIIGCDYGKKSVISNVPVLNTTVLSNKKHIINKVGNIDIESTVRGHSHRVPSRKPTTRKTATCKSVTRKPSTCKTCRNKRMVGKVKLNYKKNVVN